MENFEKPKVDPHRTLCKVEAKVDIATKQTCTIKKEMKYIFIRTRGKMPLGYFIICISLPTLSSRYKHVNLSFKEKILEISP